MAASDHAGPQRQTAARAAFWRRTLTDLAVMTVIGVFLAIIGPFGSIEEPFPVRLISWLAFSYIGYAIYSPMGMIVDRMHRALDLPVAPLWVFATFIATVPMTVMVYLVQFMPNWPPVPPLEAALTSYFYVFVIGGGVTLLFNVIGFGNRQPEQQATGIENRVDEALASPRVSVEADGEIVQPDVSTTNPLFDQLPPELGSDIIALEMEDHYVRVHTALGSHLVLMRLRDAMAYVSEIDGRQVHRSWWVARLAVEDVKRDGRNVRLVLADGLEAPVSRPQVSELKEAGWI